jgi:WhiB family transcriptional regulator, redox-sensing transcriptional regulator
MLGGMVLARRGNVRVSVQQIDNAWQVKAACRGPQSVAFFPPAHSERKDEKAEREDRAKSICRTCSVRQPCLEYALRIREPHGIWGGLNETERKAILARRLG